MIQKDFLQTFLAVKKDLTALAFDGNDNSGTEGFMNDLVADAEVGVFLRLLWFFNVIRLLVEIKFQGLHSGKFQYKTGSGIPEDFAVQEAALGAQQMEFLFGSCKSDVGDAPFFLQFLIRSKAVGIGKDVFFQTDDEDIVEFQAFCGMDGGKRNALGLLRLLSGFSSESTASSKAS